MSALRHGVGRPLSLGSEKMNCSATGISVIASLLISGCDTKQSVGQALRPFVNDLESTVSAYPDRGIVITFGNEKSELALQNQKELGEMASQLTGVVFVYADATRTDSDAAQVLREQGLRVPSNLVYDSNDGTWDVLPEIIDSSTRKEVYMRASFGIRRHHGYTSQPNKSALDNP